METEHVETADYVAFKAHVRRRCGIDLNLYKPQQMHRRLASLLERANVPDFRTYIAVLEREPDAWQAFLDRMTINVSELFRNPEKWEELRAPVLTEWMGMGQKAEQEEGKHRSRPLKVWSAGCSYGAEPYSLAILLDQIAPDVRHELRATDLDRTMLSRAREGRFTACDVKNVAPLLRERYFHDVEPAVRSTVSAARGTRLTVPLAHRSEAREPIFEACAKLREAITFQPHNLLEDPFGQDYDLICCRNVVIYFTEAAKQTLYARFYRALKPGGVLFMGSTERIFNCQAFGFDMPLPYFYRRQA